VDTPKTNAMADRFGDIDPDSPYWEALELATQFERELYQAGDVMMKATLIAQICLQNPAVISDEKVRHALVETRDAANAFLKAHP
jgi:hypothetical protein